MGHEVVCSVAMRLCTKRVRAPHQQGRSTPPLSRWTARALASPESMAAPPSVRVPCAVARLEGGERPWVPWSEPWRAAGRRDAVRTSKDSPLSKEGRVTSPVRTWRHARICWPAVPSCQRRRLLEDGGEPRWPGCRSIVESLGLEVLAQVHGHLWQLVLPPAACVPTLHDHDLRARARALAAGVTFACYTCDALCVLRDDTAGWYCEACRVVVDLGPEDRGVWHSDEEGEMLH